MARSVLLLSGPNLDLLGVRDPETYGTMSLPDLVASATAVAREMGLALEHRQSNSLGELVDWIHGARGVHDAIVVNPGAFTHFAWSLHDALAEHPGVVVEVHLSEPRAREPWRSTSVVAPVADGSISGFGALGYELAVRAAAALLARS